MLNGIEFQQPLTSNSPFIFIIRSSMVRASFLRSYPVHGSAVMTYRGIFL